MQIPPAHPAALAPADRQPRLATLGGPRPPQKDPTGQQHQDPYRGHLDDEVAHAHLHRGIGIGRRRDEVPQCGHRHGRTVVAEEPVQLVGPAHQSVQFPALAQVGTGEGIDEYLGDVALTHLRGVGRHEVDLGGSIRCRRRRHRVQDHVRRHLLPGGRDLGIERDTRGARASWVRLRDDREVAVQQKVEGLGVEDDQAGAGQQQQRRRGEQSHPEVQPPHPAQGRGLTASLRTLDSDHAHLQLRQVPTCIQLVVWAGLRVPGRRKFDEPSNQAGVGESQEVGWCRCRRAAPTRVPAGRIRIDCWPATAPAWHSRRCSTPVPNRGHRTGLATTNFSNPPATSAPTGANSKPSSPNAAATACIGFRRWFADSSTTTVSATSRSTRTVRPAPITGTWQRRASGAWTVSRCCCRHRTGPRWKPACCSGRDCSTRSSPISMVSNVR